MMTKNTLILCCFFFQAEDGIRDRSVTGVQTCAVPIGGDSSDAGGGWLGRPADAMGRGEIAVRSQTNVGAWIDSNGAGDWEGLRRYRLGQSSFAPSEFQLGGGLTPVLSPDGGDGALRSFVESAQETLDI